MKTCNFKQKQQGVALLAVVILIAVLIGAVSYFFSGSGVNTNQGQSYTAKVRASGIVSQGTSLAGGFNTMIASGISKTAITMDSATSTGLFNPTVGGATIQNPDSTALIPEASRAVTDGVWTLRTVSITDGGVAIPYYAFVLTGVSEAVCAEINTSNGLAATSVTMTGIASTASPIDISGIADFNGKHRACGLTTDGKQLYYYITGVQSAV